MANLWWPKSDCISTWTTTRIHKILLLHSWMRRQSSVSSLLKKEWACQKFPETRSHKYWESTTNRMKEYFVAIQAFKAWFDKKFCKSHEPRRSSLYLLTRKFPQTKWGKIERKYFQWSTNTRPYQRRILRHDLQGEKKVIWDSFKFVVKGFLGNRRTQNYEELVNKLLQSYQNLGCNMSIKIYLLNSHLDFFPRELLCSGWWTRRTFPSRHFFNGEEISREMELCYAPRLLLDFGKWCPYHGIQRQAKRKKWHYFVCVNSELTWKRLCRCSIYAVNIIPEHNKFKKHILFHWIVIRFLFNPAFHIILQTIS